MSQYPRSAATSSDSSYGQAQDLSRGPSSASSAGYAGRGAGGFGIEHAPPMPTIPAGVAAGGAAGAAGTSAMNAKQREAYQEHQRFHVANQQQQYGGAGPSGQPMSPTETEGTGRVTVHEDAGLADESEIPPT